jgi:Zn-dependent protease with chaperone function
VLLQPSTGVDPEYERLTAFATSRPAAYERRVVLLALLGYAYLVGALLAVVGLLAALGAFVLWWGSQGHTTGWFAFLWIGLGGLGLSMIHAFTITAPAPRGLPLVRGDHPDLLALIDELVARAGAPRLDHVLLVSDQHAGCVQLRRFGLFGPTQHYFVIGMTTLLAVTVEELRAILAHEIGHLSTQSGSTHAWIYGVRETWLRFLTSLHQRRSFTAGLFERIVAPYMAHFARYSFVLARQHEIEADRFGAGLCSARVMGDALIRLSLAERVMVRTADLSVGAARLESVGPAAQARLLLNTRIVDAAQDQRDLNAVIAGPAVIGDPHPSLAQRLSSLGVEGRVLEVPSPSAAERYFGTTVDEMCARVDNVIPAPTGEEAAADASDELVAPTAELAKLETVAVEDSTTEDLRHRAQLTDWLRGGVAALPVYTALAARDDALGHFGLGRLRLLSGDRSGLASLDRVIELDPELAGIAASIANDFLIAEGRAEEAVPYARIAEERFAEFAAKFQARFGLKVTDQITAHDLPAELAAQIGSMLSRVKPVARAYLVKKAEPDRPELRAYFLAVVYGTGWFLGNDQHEIERTTGRLQEGVATLSKEITVVGINFYAGRKAIEGIAESIVYIRPPESLPRQVLPRWGGRAQMLVLVTAVLYLLMYVYFVANIKPQYNALAGPLVLAPLVAIVGVLFWSRRDDNDAHRVVGLVGVGALIGMIIGAYVTEGEWTLALTPVLALGLLRPPADAPWTRAPLVVAASSIMGLALRLFAHYVLVG